MEARKDHSRKEGWRAGHGGKGLFAGEEGTLEVGTEAVEELELAFRQGELVDDVGEVGSLGDVEQAQEVADAVEHPGATYRLDATGDEQSPDEAHRLGAVAREAEGEVGVGGLRREHAERLRHGLHLLGDVRLQRPAQGIVLSVDFFPHPPPRGAGGGGDARPCRRGWCCGCPAARRAAS